MEKINKLKKLFNTYGIDGYLVPKNDEFFGEYVPDYKDKLKYITNFSGSFGLALILKNKNYLFVDGRYTLQAKNQSGKEFHILTFPEKFPTDVLKNKKLKIGFDPKLHTQRMINFFFNKTKCKLISIKKNLVGKLMPNREKNGVTKHFYILPKKAFKDNYKLKLKKLINILKKGKVNFQFVTSSENIAWLLNIRGHDSEYSPLTNAYLCVDVKRNVYLFCDLKKISMSLRKKLDKIHIRDIKFTDLFLSKIKGKKILLDSLTCSVHFDNILKKNNKLIRISDPIYAIKSIKSKIEINNIIKSHIYDGAALTKFLFWLKKNFKKQKISEISAQDKLLNFRKRNKSFQFSSFPTISGSGPNGAIIHYKASNKTNRKLKKGDIYLVDSGGQYNYGTTDVTRTISLENNSKRIKNIFTRVLKGHIAVANYKLNSKTNGSQIDLKARKSLKEINLDYSHGTGHGVGYFLNVHEGPYGISKNNKTNFREGVVVSNEPGYYEKGKFGIRIENLLRVKKNKKALIFDNLTMVPIDRKLIDKKLLSKNELKWLNNYHSIVFSKLKRFMRGAELKLLKESCSNL